MKSGNKYAIDMVNGPLAGKIVQFALPIMAANIIQLLFNAADVVVVGKYVGDASQAAVTSTGALVNLFVGLFSGLGVGVNVIVARALGSGDRSRISTIAHTAITAGFFCGLILCVAGILFAPGVLHLMGSPDNVIQLSSLYLRVYFLGLPGAMIYNFGSALLRAQGDSKRPMHFITIAGIANVILNLIFVVYFHWDVAGVAAATAISKYISAILVLWCLRMETGALHFDYTKLGIDWGELKKIARIGMPAGLQGCLFSLSNVTLQSAVNSMGEIIMAGTGAANNIGGFLYVTGNAFYSAAMTFTSQNYGAKKTERIDRVYRLCLLFGTLTPLVAGVSAYLFGPWLLSMYSNTPEVIQAGMLRLKLVGTVYFLSGFMEVNSGTLRGMGYAAMPLTVTLLGTCALRILWVNTVFPLFHTPESLYICVPISWMITGLIHMICFFVVRPRAYAKVRKRALEEEAKS